MDDIVRQAQIKWPNVPHCYGWLALDARGAWRMRDEQAQQRNLPGDKITNPALLSFIARNYGRDEHDCWYFQNGPQRVYVNLAATPYIARTDPMQGFVLHTGEPVSTLDGAWITESGNLIIRGNEKVAQVDDRDMAECLGMMRLDGEAVVDEQLLAWLEQPENEAHAAEKPGPKLTLNMASRHVPVQRIKQADLSAHFHFNPNPVP